jgi:hypothetical protein
MLLVWGSILGSTGLLLAVLSVVPRPAELESKELLPLFGVLGLVIAGMAVVFPAHLFRQALQRLQIETVEQPDPNALQFGAAAAGVLRVPRYPERARQSLLGAYATKTILGCALGEAVCLLGFTLGFLGLNLQLCVPFFIVGWMLIGYHMPRVSALNEEASRLLGIRF